MGQILVSSCLSLLVELIKGVPEHTEQREAVYANVVAAQDVAVISRFPPLSSAVKFMISS